MARSSLIGPGAPVANRGLRHPLVLQLKQRDRRSPPLKSMKQNVNKTDGIAFGTLILIDDYF